MLLLKHWREAFQSTVWLFVWWGFFSWRLTRNQCSISTAEGMCNRGVWAQTLQGSAARRAACKTLWGAVSGEEKNKQPRALEIGAEFTCSTSLVLSPHPLLSHPGSLTTMMWIGNTIQWPPKRAVDFFSFLMHSCSRRVKFSYYIKLRKLSLPWSAWDLSLVAANCICSGTWGWP